MATVPIRYWRTPLGCITPKASDKDVEVQSVGPRCKRENGRATEEIEGFNVTFLAIKGCSQTVKLPLSAQKSVDALLTILSDKQTIVRVRFVNLVMRGYSMQSNGELFTGISATADDFEITATEKPDIDDDLIDFA